MCETSMYLYSTGTLTTAEFSQNLYIAERLVLLQQQDGDRKNSPPSMNINPKSSLF